mgnify:CR=1 FL=1
MRRWRPRAALHRRRQPVFEVQLDAGLRCVGVAGGEGGHQVAVLLQRFFEIAIVVQRLDQKTQRRRIFGSQMQAQRLTMEKVGQADAAEERVVDHLLLKELLKNLDKDERKLIYLRYFSEKTQTQVGKELGISQVQVSRMEKRILRSLQESAEKK